MSGIKILVKVGLLFFFLSHSTAFSQKQTAPEKAKKKGDGKALIGIAHQIIELNKTTPITLTDPQWAYKISFILPDSAAFKGGLKSGDILLAWDGNTLDTTPKKNRASALRDYLKNNKNVGDPLTLEILRYQTKILKKTPNTNPQKISSNEWYKLIENNQKNEQFDIQVKHQKIYQSKNITLGKRYDDIELPDNQTLYKGEKSKPLLPTITSKELIKVYDLGEDYQDLLNRYEENEKWEKGFRLNLFRYLHRAPDQVLKVTNIETQKIVNNADKGTNQLTYFLANYLDREQQKVLPKNSPKPTTAIPKSNKLKDHLDYAEIILEKTYHAYQQALIKLKPEEQQQLYKILPKVMQRFAQSFYINIKSKKTVNTEQVDVHKENQQALEQIKKIDKSQLIVASTYLQELNNPAWLKQLRQHNLTWQSQNTKGVIGKVLGVRETKYGRIILGSTQNNNYKSNESIIIDLGGDDTYFGSNNGKKSPVNLIIDYQGNDNYSSTAPFSHGSTLIGVSLLFDYTGNDHYTGAYFSEGTAVVGVGLLQDYQGDDIYLGQRFAQGVGFWGIGMLIDNQGDDQYHAWKYAQGVGGVGGIGLLLDDKGNDQYTAVGESKSSYGGNSNFQSSSQGFGVGFRGYASGGLGFLLDRKGNDHYRAGNFAQGTGYFYGMGVLRDFSEGDDNFQASRYGLGASAHSAIGVVIEDGGNDNYQGNLIAILAAAWDLGIAVFWDKKGNDNYLNYERGFNIGVANHNGYSVFYDSAGKDKYTIQINSSSEVDNKYHGGKSFSFFYDIGKKENIFSNSFTNNSIDYRRGHAFVVIQKSLPNLLTKEK